MAQQTSGEGTVSFHMLCVEQQRCCAKETEPHVSFWAQLCNPSAVQSEVFPSQLEFQTTFLAGWSPGHSALHFPLVAGAPGRAEPHCWLWVFPQVCFFNFHGSIAGFQH